MAHAPSLVLGSWRTMDDQDGGEALDLPAHHLVTHGVVVGMTGSGKTGLLTVLVEEALRAGVPTLVVDVKGDLPNLLLSFPDFNPERLLPWIERAPDDPTPEAEIAVRLAEDRRRELQESGIGEAELAQFCANNAVRVLTPGSEVGEPVHMLSSLERCSRRWNTDPSAARDTLGAAVSLLLRLIGRDADPTKSREHVLLSVLAERRLSAGEPADLAALMADLETPPIDDIGALPVDAFIRPAERRKLAASINSLLASPSFAAFRKGESLDVGKWLTPTDHRTPSVVVSVAHLDDQERELVLGMLLEEVLGWVRTLPGSQYLKALVVFDEIYGFLPPHPHNPATKRPLVALMKQARAFGVGVVVATQNPMDLDYRALSNAGLWCLGRLQTDADRERVVDGLAAEVQVSTKSDDEDDPIDLGDTLKRLAPRWFVVRDAHVSCDPILVKPRHTITLMRGPMTGAQMRKLRENSSTAPQAPWQSTRPGAVEPDETLPGI